MIKRIIALVSVIIVSSVLMGSYEDGMVMFKRAEYTKAVDFFKEVVQQAPDQYQGYQMLGLCYIKLHKINEATTNLGKAFSLKKGDPALALSLANLYFQAKRFDKALTVLKQVNVRTIKNPVMIFKLYYQRGLASYKGGDYRRAASDLKSAINVKKNADAAYYAGLSYYKLGKYADASTYFDKAIKAGVKNHRTRYWYIQSLNQKARKERSDQKIATYRKASVAAKTLARDESSYDNLLLAGETLLGSRSYSEASTYFKKAKALKPKDAYASYYLGKTLSLTGKYAESQKELKAALASGTSSLTKIINEQMAFNFHKLKNFDEALAIYQKLGDQKMVAFEKDARKKVQNNIRADKEQKEYERKLKEQKENQAS